MSTLEDVIKATDFLKNKSNIDKLVISSASKFTDEILKLNKEQLNKGELNNGDKTQEYASISYANYKSSIGSKSGINADLKLTGNFQDKFKAINKNLSIDIKSTDSKAIDLENKYTVDIYGLQEKNAQKIGVLTAPVFEKKIRDEFKK